MPTIDMPATGRKIHDMRIAAGMTIRHVQDACGVSAAAVTKWQKGLTLPTVDNLVILAALWNVQIDDLIAIKRV